MAREIVIRVSAERIEELMRLAAATSIPFDTPEFCAAVALDVGIEEQKRLYRLLAELQGRLHQGG